MISLSAKLPLGDQRSERLCKLPIDPANFGFHPLDGERTPEILDPCRRGALALLARAGEGYGDRCKLFDLPLIDCGDAATALDHLVGATAIPVCDHRNAMRDGLYQS